MRSELYLLCRPYHQASSHNALIRVIAISGLAEARPENWLCNSEPWLKSMMNRHPGKVQIWSYEWASPGPKGSLLDCLSAEGTSFASALCALCERNVVRSPGLLTGAVYSRDLSRSIDVLS